MSKLRLPAFNDVARIIAGDVDETEARLLEYYADANRAPFNYRTAVGLSRHAFERKLPLQQILEGCRNEATEQGQRSNREVLSLLYADADSRSVRTHVLGAKPLNIRKDLSIRVAPPFHFVERERAYVFWLQPRKTYALNQTALALLSSMVKATFLVDDFEDVGFEMCDMSSPTPSKPRVIKTYHLESFDILSQQEIEWRLQTLAVAYDRVVARGITRSQRSQPKRSRLGPDLLGPTPS